jgi:adenosine/AMP kinase
MRLVTLPIEKPSEVALILGQAHFIKTVEDLHEALASSVPAIKFGLAFCEASGDCLVRSSGTDPSLTSLAAENASNLSAGHSFLILLKGAYPVNVLNAVKAVPEVCGIYCATSNPVEVVLAETSLGRGIVGIVDGERTKGVETKKDAAARKKLLRDIGYKL